MKTLTNPVSTNITLIYKDENGQVIPIKYVGPNSRLPDQFSDVENINTKELLTVETTKIQRNISQSLNIPNL